MNIVANMLKENTGRAAMDSGGAYGRNWERNQARAFEAEPASTVRFSIWNREGGDKLEVNVTHNVYHFLKHAVTFAPNMDKRFQRYCKRKDNADSHYLELMESFPKWLETRGHDIGGIYGEGDPMTVNTYNGEDLLSQVLQYTYFTCDKTPYVALQIHGGCDVRGGYTAPRVFEVNDDTAIMDNARASLWEVSNEGRAVTGHNWSTDDGYHWYPGSYQIDLPLLDVKEHVDSPKLESLPLSEDPALIGDGVHFVVVDGVGYLPNGNRLEAGL